MTPAPAPALTAAAGFLGFTAGAALGWWLVCRPLWRALIGTH